MPSLKRQVLSGLIWSGIHRFGVLFIAFVSNLILARILSPEDFGNIGILLVFTAICQACIDGGFGAALVQKKDTTDTDYSTVFYWNLIVAAIMIAVIYISAPIVGDYYKSDLLCDILRMQSLALFINAFSLVQTAKLTKELNFKILATRTVAAAAVSSIAAIMLALAGWGVWSLVAKEIINALVGAALLWTFCKWHPSRTFSVESFRKMFGFGSMIFLSSIVDTVYRNIQSLIIGRAFSIRDLGYYTQAKKMEEIPIQGATAVLTQVLFPLYSSIADQREYMKSVVRKNIVLITYFSFPVMTLLIITARPLLTILFTDKWAESIPLFQILCIDGIFYPLNCANTEIFKAIGRGDVYFVLQTIKRVACLAIIIFSIRYGLYPMMWTVAATGILFYAANIAFTHKVFGYHIGEQLSDIAPNLLLSISAAGAAWYISDMAGTANNYISLLYGTLSYAIIYIVSSALFKIKGLSLVRDILKRQPAA